MRLDQEDVSKIKQCLSYFDDSAQLYLFGSRTDDNKKGGDIDLIIISKKIDFPEKLRLKVCLKETLGDQKFDIVTSADKMPPLFNWLWNPPYGLSNMSTNINLF